MINGPDESSHQDQLRADRFHYSLPAVWLNSIERLLLLSMVAAHRYL